MMSLVAVFCVCMTAVIDETCIADGRRLGGHAWPLRAAGRDVAAAGIVDRRCEAYIGWRYVG